MKINKAILLINISGKFGGAEKRYINLYNYIAQQRDDYYLIINDSLYENFKRNKLIETNSHIIILRLEKKSGHPLIAKVANNKAIRSSDTIEKKKNRIRIFLGRNKYFFKLFLQWLSFAVQMVRILKQNRFTTIYAIWFGGIWIWPLKKIFNFRLIHSYMDSAIASIAREYWHFFDSEYWVLKHCNKIDFLSQGIISNLEKSIGLINSNRISITPNSFINYDNYYPKYPKDNSVIFMSRLTPPKNPMLFLNAINILAKRKQEFSKIEFYILGEGPLEKDIVGFIKRNDLKNVHFEEMIYEPWKYLRRSNVFLSIMQYENYPSQSLLEAMACENAIIASDVGETRLLVTENEGILVNLDAEEIANAIEKLFTTPGLIEKLGKNARKKVLKEHTIEKFAEYFYSITEA